MKISTNTTRPVVKIKDTIAGYVYSEFVDSGRYFLRVDSSIYKLQYKSVIRPICFLNLEANMLDSWSNLDHELFLVGKASEIIIN